MQINTQKHRHAVAAPIVVLALGILTILEGGLQGYGASAASLFQFWEARAEMPFSSEVAQGILQEGTWLTQEENGDLHLGQGDALLHASGVVKIVMGAKEAKAIGGSFLASVGGTSASIAAITTPVLLRSNEELFFVPVGYQLRWQGIDKPALQVLPVDYLQEQLQKALKLVLEHVDRSITQRPPCMDGSELPKFEAAKERERAACMDDIIFYIGSRIAVGDRAEVQALLPLFAEDGDVALALLESALASPSMLIDLLPLIQDPQVRTLAFLHPALATAAWTSLDFDSLEKDQQMLVLQQFPFADTLPHAFDALAVDRWGAALRQSIEAETGTPQWLTETVPHYGEALKRLQALEYPERHARYLSLFRSHAQILPVFAGIAADPVVTEELTPAVVNSSSSAASVEQPVQLPALPESEVVYRAHAWLQTAGALFTTQTAVTPAGPNLAQIDGVIFSTAQGDHLYRFVIDLVHGTVSSITVDGQLLPFPMTMESFGSWVLQNR